MIFLYLLNLCVFQEVLQVAEEPGGRLAGCSPPRAASCPTWPGHGLQQHWDISHLGDNRKNGLFIKTHPQWDIWIYYIILLYHGIIQIGYYSGNHRDMLNVPGYRNTPKLDGYQLARDWPSRWIWNVDLAQQKGKKIMAHVWYLSNKDDVQTDNFFHVWVHTSIFFSTMS